MSTLLQDVRHAVRLFPNSPAFAVGAVVVLALGIGANSAIFSIVQAVLLRPLPFAEPDRLVRVWHVPPPKAFPGMTRFSVSAANYLDWESQNHVFEKTAILGFMGLNLTGSGEPESVPGARVSHEFFQVLGTRPLHGRTFTASDDAPGAPRVVVLGYGFWRSRFAGDPGIVGRDVRFNGEPYRVIGVMGPEMTMPDFSKVWVPMSWTAEDRAVRNDHNYIVIARLKRGIDLARAQTEMNLLSARLARQYPEDDADWGAVVVPMHEDIVGDVRPLLLVLLGAVVFVLLIACANVANLMLARTVTRQREIAVRTALGASRGRILRQLFVEALVLSLAGGAVGLFAASFGMKGLATLLADEIPHWTVVGVDGRVLLFTLAVSIATGALAGLAPAWRGTRSNVADALKQGLGRAGSDGARRRTRSVLVVSEVALSIVLLIGAGLLIRTMWALRHENPGFDPRGLTTMSFQLPKPKYPEGPSKTAFFERLIARLSALPGVESVGATSDLPLLGGQNWPVQLEGRAPVPVSQQPNVFTSQIAGDYFRTMRIPVERGRLFNASDTADSPGVAVISQAMARQFWPNEDPIGKRFVTAFAGPAPREVIGIVADVKLRGLEVREPVAAMYLPVEQVPRAGMDFVIRSRVPVATAAVGALHALDPEQPALQLGTMEQALSDSLVRQRFAMILLGSFAVLALVLAAVGIYSVLSYTVRNRRREIGIRMALGAQIRDVVRLVVLQGMRPAGLGIAIGLAAALALGHLLSSVVYGVTPGDPWTLAAVAAVLAVVALFACLLPARRATRVDPIRALREE